MIVHAVIFAGLGIAVAIAVIKGAHQWTRGISLVAAIYAAIVWFT